MRSKPVLALIWVASTVVAVTIVWQSLGFVSTRTDGSLDGAVDDTTAGPVGATTATPTPTTAGSTASEPAVATSGSTAATSEPGSSAPTVTDTTGSTGATGDEVPADAQDQTFELVGGSTTVRYAGGGVTVLWAVPNPGFEAEIEPEGTGLKVEFRSESHRSRVDVWWADVPRNQIREESD